jgi:RNA polymerase sigma-70 factor (ECF subfamily)
MNVCLSSLDKRKRRARAEQNLKPDEPEEPRPVTPLLRRSMEQALAQLPEGYRATLILHDVEGLSHEEVAAVLGCRVGTSKSQLHKARMRMRELLEPTLHEERGQ